MVVKRYLVIIQLVDDFYQWGKIQENSFLKYMFVLKFYCVDVYVELINFVGK